MNQLPGLNFFLGEEIDMLRDSVAGYAAKVTVALDLVNAQVRMSAIREPNTPAALEISSMAIMWATYPISDPP